jgi:hypothetical protein
MGFKSFILKKTLQAKGVPKEQAEKLADELSNNPQLAESLKSLEKDPQIKALMEKLQKEIEEKKKSGMNEQLAAISVMEKYKSEIAKHREALEPLMRLMM